MTTEPKPFDALRDHCYHHHDLTLTDSELVDMAYAAWPGLARAVQERDAAITEARRLKLKIQHAFNNGYVLKPERDEDPEPTRDDPPPHRSPRCGVCYWALYDGAQCQNQSCTERGKYIGENRINLSNEEAAVLIEWRKTK